MTKIMAKKYFTQRKRIREFFFYIIEKEKNTGGISVDN